MPVGQYVRTPEIREKARQARLGKRHTDEWKKRLSDARKGKPAKNKFTDQYSDWIELYQRGEECRDIAARYGCSSATVARVIQTRSIKRHVERQGANYAEWTELYKSGMTLEGIGAKFGCSGYDVGYGLRKLKVARRDASHARQVHPIDETFFDIIDNDSKAYWLGFISADGCISSSANRLVIGLSAKDADMIYKFLSCLKSDLLPDFYMGGRGKAQNMVRISINNQHLTNTLKACGLTPRKSLTLEFSKSIPRQLQGSYVRGYFDGDGSIYFDKAGKPYFALVGTAIFLKRVQDIMVREIGLNYTKIRSKGKISELRYIGKNNVIKVRDWLYSGGQTWMQRKRDRFDSIG